MKDRKVLVPLDDSQLSTQTVQRMIAHRECFRTSLTLLHVLDFSRISYRGFAQKTFEEIEEQARAEARQFISGQLEVFAKAGIQAEVLVKEGAALETICALADSGAYDLLVIGKKPESDLRNFLFGQVANFVIRQVKCPVMIV